ncbi:MAG: threonine/serine dehydratase [Sphingomonas sp.]|jgi:threonine dehydratase|uniref:threonine/serine dehydratase n=1 Tax=Sphingomonas sp. TaxID=28214 RepID=UPI003569B4A9
MATLFERIMEADKGIRPQVPVSGLEYSAKLSGALGCEVMLKTDHLMPTGSFKVRGSANKIRTLGEAARGGVITASTGNHGQGVARAGKLAGVPVTVYLPSSAPPAKMRAIEALGATLVVFDGPSLEAELEARRQSDLQGKPYVAPYNDYDTIAGQGTLGMELFNQAPDLDAVFICVGGGGLISGVGTAMKQLSPNTTIVGVWPQASRCMLDSLEAGHIIETPEYDTLSDGSTGAVEQGSVTFPICQQVIDETLTVSEIEIARGMRRIAEAERWMIEGSAGVAVAGLLQTAETWRGKKVAVVLCGRNVSVETFMGAMELGRED